MLARLCATQAMAPAPESSNGGLFATVEIAKIDNNGSIRMPPDVRDVVIEIGCSDRNTLDDEHLPFRPSSFLISFEPLVDKYASLLAKANFRFNHGLKDLATPLGHHDPHGVVLPIAVSAEGGPANFSVSSVSGCSSLMEINANTTWGKWCIDRTERRSIQTISLDQAVRYAGNRPVSRLKIDAQGVYRRRGHLAGMDCSGAILALPLCVGYASAGLDFQIIRAASPATLSKISKIQMEVRSSSCPPLYHGQESCEEVERAVAKLGFQAANRCPTGSAATACEADLFLYNTRGGLHRRDEDMPKRWGLVSMFGTGWRASKIQMWKLSADLRKLAAYRDSFLKIFEESQTKIIYRYCDDCVKSHQHIFYRRLKSDRAGNSWHPFDSLVRCWRSDDNDMEAGDFALFSTWDDAVQQVRAWQYCDYDESCMRGVGAFGSCGPSGIANYQWSSLTDLHFSVERHRFYVHVGTPPMGFRRPTEPSAPRSRFRTRRAGISTCAASMIQRTKNASLEHSLPTFPEYELFATGCCRVAANTSRGDAWTTVFPSPHRNMGQLTAAECACACSGTEGCDAFELNSHGLQLPCGRATAPMYATGPQTSARGDCRASCWLFSTQGRTLRGGCERESEQQLCYVPRGSQAQTDTSDVAAQDVGEMMPSAAPVKRVMPTDASTAVCLIGQPRTLPETADSLRNHLLDEWQADAYVVTLLDDSAPPISALLEAFAMLGPRVRGMVAGNLEEVFGRANQRRILLNSKAHDRSVYVSAINRNLKVAGINQFLERARCFDLVRQAERKRGYPYEVYARVRLDTLLFQPIPINRLRRSAMIPAGERYAPIGAKVPCVTDKMVIGDNHTFRADSTVWKAFLPGAPEDITFPGWLNECVQEKWLLSQGIALSPQPLAYCIWGRTGCRFFGELRRSANLLPDLLATRGKVLCRALLATLRDHEKCSPLRSFFPPPDFDSSTEDKGMCDLVGKCRAVS